MTEQLKPCPFCGGDVETFKHNGTTQVTCGASHTACAGTDVGAPIAMWNARAAMRPTPQDTTCPTCEDGLTIAYLAGAHDAKKITPQEADYDDIPNTPEQRALIKRHNEEMRRKHPNLKSIYPTSQDDEAKVRAKAEELYHEYCQTIPGPPSPPLFSAVRMGPLNRKIQAEFTERALQYLADEGQKCDAMTPQQAAKVLLGDMDAIGNYPHDPQPAVNWGAVWRAMSDDMEDNGWADLPSAMDAALRAIASEDSQPVGAHSASIEEIEPPDGTRPIGKWIKCDCGVERDTAFYCATEGCEFGKGEDSK